MNVNSFYLISASTGQQVTSAVDSSTRVTDSAVAKTDTFTIVPTECRTVETSIPVNAQWICIGAILIVIFVLTYLFYKRIKALKDDVQRLNMIITNQNDVITFQNNTIESLRNRLDTFEHDATRSMTTPPPFNTKRAESRHVSIGVTTPTTIEPIESGSEIQSISATVKYATLQAPDANGTLRFAERSMTDEVSDQKMFEVELDTVNGTGRYRVNLRAKSMLMSDLQQLRDFVEPFTINGNNSAQQIINEKPGKIHQDGKFWIVDELAKIKIV